MKRLVSCAIGLFLCPVLAQPTVELPSSRIVVIFSPPKVLPCGSPGWLVKFPDNLEAYAVELNYLPDEFGIEVTLVAEGRIFCNGFE